MVPDHPIEGNSSYFYGRANHNSSRTFANFNMTIYMVVEVSKDMTINLLLSKSWLKSKLIVGSRQYVIAK
uniref:Uncharacterized protein n=1 Tax=Pararge aegeria TaxID=116150 RepID=S4NSK9_9NEOP